MRKRCLILAFLLALTAVVPVRTAAAETVMQSEIALVDVTVPKAGQIVLNPYGLPVEVGSETTTEQIASETMTITNNGDTPVVVSASVSGCIAEQSSMAFVTAPPPADAAEKEVFIYAEFQDRDSQWADGYSGMDNQIMVSNSVSETQEVLTLDADAKGVFRLFGATAVSPDDPWSGEDAVSVVLTFSFVPVIESAETVIEEEDPSTEPAEDPVAEPTEDPAIEPTEDPATEPAEGPATEPVEDLATEPAEDLATEPAEDPTTESAENPVVEPAEDPAAEPSEDSAAEPFGVPAENQNPVPTNGEECVETNGDADPGRLEAGLL